ncbi:MAG TPA: DUF4861 domain-containing protein [bacterium]|nr:DUF4861 domain-containing protein [bacterium]
MRKISCSLLLAALLLAACTSEVEKKLQQEYPGKVLLTLKNPLANDRPDEVVAIPLDLIRAKAADFNPRAVVLAAKGRELPVQLCDDNGDGAPDHLLANLDAGAGERSRLILRYAPEGVKERIYTPRAHAELSAKFGGEWVQRKYVGGTFHKVDFLRVPPEHTDHSEYIRYEGPGWESDRVGFRFYLDWRNATDIFGKRSRELVLHRVGLEDFENYHHMSDWGMDILKVGPALGIGTVAWWDGASANRVAVTDSIHCRVAAAGPLLARIRTDYFGWKAGTNTLNLRSDLSITAGSRMTRHVLRLDSAIDNLCTGLVKLPDTEVIPPPAEGEWSWLATWGVQSLNQDRLGMAIFFRRADLISTTGDDLNHVVVLRPSQQKLEYYFLAAWELEPGGITSREAFAAELAAVAARLNNPLIIE